MNIYTNIADWLNNNQGVLTLSIFLITVFFGWASGIFSALRNKPNFKISLIDGPTFSCTYPVVEEGSEQEVHRTGITLYLSVANTGSSPSSIDYVYVAYHLDTRLFSAHWVKFSIGWFVINKQIAALDDFQAKIGDSVKIFPFLFQKNTFDIKSPETYIKVGQSTNGVVYFEQPTIWDGYVPKVKKGKLKIKVVVLDSYGKKHVKKFTILSVPIEYARTYNPSFGKTYSELKGENLPHDYEI